MNNRLILPVIIAATLLSANVFAGKQGSFYVSASVGESSYDGDLAQQAGLSDYVDDYIDDLFFSPSPDDLTQGSSADNTARAFNFQLGYFVTNILAFEVGYVDFGRVTASAGSTEIYEGSFGNIETGEQGLINGVETNTYSASASADGFTFGANLYLPTPIERLDFNLSLGLVSWESNNSTQNNTSDVYTKGSEVPESSTYNDTLSVGGDSGTDVYYGAGLSYHFDDISINTKYTRYDIGGTDVDTFTIGLAHTF